ncbi:GNAT family N-acetyltransferase [Nocardioides sp. NPDC057577]|uniref:GNAT family N-acetyltransferase n=1 Tax=Nocardioides sp. NPDC057577 TaxID=3346171 RepID=UPI0036730CB5
MPRVTTDARPIAETSSVLDNIVWESLVGPNRHLGKISGLAARYDPQVAAFAGIAEDSPRAWADLAALLGPAGTCFFTSPRPVRPPVGWEVLGGGEGVQMIDDGVVAVPDADVVVLGPADVPEILDLIERTRPGPFEPRTIEMGTYLGIRAGGRLVAMAGERNHPRGWTEVSAVCTDADFRGQGLAGRLVRAVTYGINQRGERALLHASGTNENAIRLYQALGFTLRRTTNFAHLRAPV